MLSKDKGRVKSVIIMCLLAVLATESVCFFNAKKNNVDLQALNQLDAYGVVNEYLLAQKTGKRGLLTLRLLDRFYDKSEDYLSAHSDAFNIMSVEIKKIEEIAMSADEIEEVKRMSVESGFASYPQIEDVKQFSVEYTLMPIDEEKGFLTDESYDRKHKIRLVKRFGIWKIFDQGMG